MTSAEELVTRMADRAEPEVMELTRRATEGEITPLSRPKPSSASILRRRDATTTKGGASKSGFSALLSALDRQGGDDVILVYWCHADDKLYSVYVTERDLEFVGCIWIARSSKKGPEPWMRRR